MSKEAKKTAKHGLSRTAREYLFCYGWLAWPLVFFAVFWVYVNLNGILLAFQSVDFLGNKEWVGLENFRTFLSGVFADGDVFAISVRNSIVGYLLSAAINMPLGLLFSYLMFKKARGSRIFTFIFLLPQIVSMFIYVLVFRNFAYDGFTEFFALFGIKVPNFMGDPKYAFGLTCGFGIWCGFGMTLIINANAMRNIDPALFESAKIDGMRTIFQEFRFIIMPLILPTFMTQFVVGIGGIFSSPGYLTAFYFSSAPVEAYNMGYYMWQRVYTSLGNNESFSIVAASGLTLSLVVLPFVLLARQLADKSSEVY